MAEGTRITIHDLPKHTHECFEMKGDNVCLVCLMEEWADGSLHEFPGREEMIADRMRFDAAQRYEHTNAHGGICPVHIEHDEAMRMQALAIGARLSCDKGLDQGSGDHREQVRDWARWAYREATGRAW